MTEEEFKKAMIQFLKQLEGMKKMAQEIVNRIDGRIKNDNGYGRT